jgi:LuxR family maltose regulon positive regulatory protein
VARAASERHWRPGHAITLAGSSGPGPPGRSGWTYRQALEITAAPGHPGSAGRGHRVRGLAEPLTAREPRARRDQHIAGELVVTPGTVKKHVSHLLGKLSAANRTEIVTRARQLSLIR